MLKLFITKQDFTNIVLIIYILIFQLLGHQSVSLDYDFGVFDNFFDNFNSASPVFSRIIAGTLLMIQALSINIILKKVHYFKLDNLLGGLFFIFLNMMSSDFLIITPSLIINSLLIFGLYEASKLYNVRENIKSISNIGLVIGFSMLINPLVLLFLLFGYLTLNVYRPFKLNEKLALLISIIVPLFLVRAYCLYYDINYPSFEFWSTRLSFLDFDYFQWTIIATYSILLLISVFNPTGHFFRKVIEAEKYRQVIFWFLLSGIFVAILSSPNYLDNLRLLSFPLAVTLSIKVLSIPKSWGEVVHILTLLIVLFCLVGPRFIVL